MNDEKRPAWREPMVWLVFAIPLMSVFAVGGLMVAAHRAGGVDGVADTVKRTGQIQTTNTGPSETALQLNLSAVVKTDGKRVEVFPSGGDFDRSQDVVLKLRHPVNAAEDITLPLKATLHGWAADTVLPLEHDWVLELEPADNAWRLDGRWPAHQQAALLKPSMNAGP